MKWLQRMRGIKPEDEILREAEDAQHFLNDPAFNDIMQEMEDALEKAMLSTSTEKERSDAVIAKQVFAGMKRALMRRIENGQAINFQKGKVLNFRG